MAKSSVFTAAAALGFASVGQDQSSHCFILNDTIAARYETIIFQLILHSRYNNRQ